MLQTLAAKTHEQLDTTIPGLSRRRLWAAPVLAQHSLLCLTLSKVYLAPAGQDAKPETQQAILNGADLNTAFGEQSIIIDISTIQRVRHKLIDNTLVIDYLRADNKSLRSVGNLAQVLIKFSHFEAADEVFSKLWRRMGQSYTMKPSKTETWELLRIPLAFMAAIVLSTLTLSLVANSLADGDPHRTGKTFLAPLANTDWRWICALGGAALAATQVWLYRRYTKPPEVLELIASPTR